MNVIDHMKSSFSELSPVVKLNDIIGVAGASHRSIINLALIKFLVEGGNTSGARTIGAVRGAHLASPEKYVFK